MINNESYKETINNMVDDIINRLQSHEFKDNDSDHANINKLIISSILEIGYYDDESIEELIESMCSLIDEKIVKNIYYIQKLLNQKFRIEEIYNIKIKKDELYNYIRSNFNFPYQDLKLNKKLYDEYIHHTDFSNIKKVVEKFDDIFCSVITKYRKFTDEDQELLLQIGNSDIIFEHCLFENITFTNKYDKICFHSRFNKCKFKNIQLIDTTFCFKMARFSCCFFDNCNLGDISEIKFVHAEFNKCDFYNCFSHCNDIYYLNNIEDIDINKFVLIQLCRYINKQNGYMKDCTFNEYTIPNIKAILSFDSSVWTTSS